MFVMMYIKDIYIDIRIDICDWHRRPMMSHVTALPEVSFVLQSVTLSKTCRRLHPESQPNSALFIQNFGLTADCTYINIVSCWLRPFFFFCTRTIGVLTSQCLPTSCSVCFLVYLLSRKVYAPSWLWKTICASWWKQSLCVVYPVFLCFQLVFPSFRC